MRHKEDRTRQEGQDGMGETDRWLGGKFKMKKEGPLIEHINKQIAQEEPEEESEENHRRTSG